MSEDCYFFWDGEDVPYEERKIYMQCTKCYGDEGKPNYHKGVLWTARGGYADVEVRCSCGEIIHSPKQNDED